MMNLKNDSHTTAAPFPCAGPEEIVKAICGTPQKQPSTAVDCSERFAKLLQTVREYCVSADS